MSRRYHILIKRPFLIILAYLCFSAAFYCMTLLAVFREAPFFLCLHRAHRSHWLYVADGTLGYRWIEPRVSYTPAWASTSEDTWHYYPLDQAITNHRNFLFFGYAHQRSTYRGESGRCWISPVLLAVAFGIAGARFAFARAIAAPLKPIPLRDPTSMDPNSTAPVPILAYSSGNKTRIAHSTGIRTFSVSAVTFFIGIIAYFLYRSTQTLGGIFDWIAPIVVAAGGAIFFFLIAVGGIKRRV